MNRETSIHSSHTLIVDDRSRQRRWVIIGVVVTVYKDRTLDFQHKIPPASVMMKDAVKGEKGSGEPNKNKIGKVTMAQCRKIAEEKGKDLNSFDLDKGARVIAGTARSMGITVEG